MFKKCLDMAKISIKFASWEPINIVFKVKINDRIHDICVVEEDSVPVFYGEVEARKSVSLSSSKMSKWPKKGWSEWQEFFDEENCVFNVKNNEESRIEIQKDLDENKGVNISVRGNHS